MLIYSIQSCIHSLQGMPSLDIMEMISSTKLMLKNHVIQVQKQMQREREKNKNKNKNDDVSNFFNVELGGIPSCVGGLVGHRLQTRHAWHFFLPLTELPTTTHCLNAYMVMNWGHLCFFYSLSQSDEKKLSENLQF